MISKNIVLSMIVIGCLVQFITCPSPADNNTPNKPFQNGASKPSSSKPSSSKPSSSKPSSGKPSSGNNPQGNPPQGAKKSGASPAKKTGAQPRGLQNNPANNGQVKGPKPSAKKPNGFKKPEASDNQNKNIDSIPENEELMNGEPTGGIRRAFNMFNGFRKKLSPFRLFGKVVKKTREVGTNMFGTVMNTIKPISKNNNDDDDTSQNNA